MSEFGRLLEEQLPWLRGRVAQRARAVGSGGGELQDDLLQETVMIALQRAPRFFEGPSMNEAARMRTLLKVCLKSAFTNLLRQQEKAPVHDGDEFPLAREAETPESLVAGAQYQAAHIASARAELTPNLALAYLCSVFPDAVSEADFERAATFRGGGATGLARPASEAWALFQRLRQEQLPKVGDAEWKRLVVETLRSEAPLGEADERLLERGIRNLDTQLTRARKRLGIEMPELTSRGQAS